VNANLSPPFDVQGVILLDASALGLCGGVTGASYTMTTEVYPDSPSATAEQCNQAQVASVVGALESLRGEAKQEL